MIYQDYGLGFTLLAIISFIIIVIIIMIFLNALFLKIALSIVKAKYKDLASVFITALLCALVSWIPCIGWILSAIIINKRHKTGLLFAIVVLIIVIIIAIIIAIVIFLVFFGPITPS